MEKQSEENAQGKNTPLSNGNLLFISVPFDITIISMVINCISSPSKGHVGCPAVFSLSIPGEQSLGS